jgi:hypothetical protein
MYTCIRYEEPYTLRFTRTFCGFEGSRPLPLLARAREVLAGVAAHLLQPKKVGEYPKLHYAVLRGMICLLDRGCTENVGPNSDSPSCNNLLG